jgi:lipoprotein signal peptidase
MQNVFYILHIDQHNTTFDYTLHPFVHISCMRTNTLEEVRAFLSLVYSYNAGARFGFFAPVGPVACTAEVPKVLLCILYSILPFT